MNARDSRIFFILIIMHTYLLHNSLHNSRDLHILYSSIIVTTLHLSFPQIIDLTKSLQKINTLNRAHKRGVVLRRRLKFLGYLPCTVVA